MIPERLQGHFERKLQKRDSDNGLVEGMLTCCDSSDFEVFVVGKIEHSLFSKMYLVAENDRVVLEARCKKCGKGIVVFDSCYDGYDRIGTNPSAHGETKPIACRKCQDHAFAVRIRYEYPDVEELKNLEIGEMGNAFTWISISLECSKCGTKYKNFIDYETA